MVTMRKEEIITHVELCCNLVYISLSFYEISRAKVIGNQQFVFVLVVVF